MICGCECFRYQFNIGAGCKLLGSGGGKRYRIFDAIPF